MFITTSLLLLVSESGKMVERKSLPTIKQIAIVKILLESRAEMTPVSHEPSEFEKLKH